MIVSMDLVRQIYHHTMHVKLNSDTYLSVESVDEGRPNNKVGYSEGYDKNNKGGHPRVNDALELVIGRFLHYIYEAAEGVLNEPKLNDVEL